MTWAVKSFKPRHFIKYSAGVADPKKVSLSPALVPPVRKEIFIVSVLNIFWVSFAHFDGHDK